MAKYGMAIDLQRCVGCGACAFACKSENNTEFEHEGEKYNWADFFTFTEGTFAEGNVRYKVIPVLCNHCTDAVCVDVCPVEPRAMYKTADGITMHNDDSCIGCQLCQEYCPYSSMDVNADGVQYSVISYNPRGLNTQRFYEDETAVIPGGTSSPAEIGQLAGEIPPDKNKYSHPDYRAVRPSDVTEKCIFCDHRIKEGKLPYCVNACPSDARIFGDLDDPNSAVSAAIKNGYRRLKNNSGEMLKPGNEGLRPNVYYLNDFSGDIVGKREPQIVKKLVRVYPNPTSAITTVEFELSLASTVSFSLYDISGKEIWRIADKEKKQAGKQTLTFDAERLNSGTYIGRLQAENSIEALHIVVSR